MPSFPRLETYVCTNSNNMDLFSVLPYIDHSSPASFFGTIWPIAFSFEPESVLRFLVSWDLSGPSQHTATMQNRITINGPKRIKSPQPRFRFQIVSVIVVPFLPRLCRPLVLPRRSRPSIAVEAICARDAVSQRVPTVAVGQVDSLAVERSAQDDSLLRSWSVHSHAVYNGVACSVICMSTSQNNRCRLSDMSPVHQIAQTSQS